MRLSFIIFYTVVLAIYFLVNYYIFIRGFNSLNAGSRERSIYTGLFLFLSLSFVAGRIMESYWLGFPTGFLVWTGSFWLGAMVYLVLILLAVDLVRVINILLPVIPGSWLTNLASTKRVLFYAITSVVIITVVAAHINSRIVKITNVETDLSHISNQNRTIKLVMASDVHLGILTPRHRILRMVEKINSLEPDIVIFAGDIMDEDVGPVIKKNLGSAISKLKATYGVYAVTGNHEYIGGAEASVNYLSEHGINFLRDSVIVIDNSFYLAGREDLNIDRFAGKTRKSVAELLEGVGKELPVILIDHQPFNLEKAAAAGVNLQLSGHTHHGQLWPFNYITKAMYEISSGYGIIEGMHVYVSNGVGTWGPPMRLGNRPEIVNIKVKL